jgi:hypothetical protein
LAVSHSNASVTTCDINNKTIMISYCDMV